MEQQDFSDQQFSSLRDIRKLLESEAEGIATLKMWQLRDAFGARKLGSNNVEEISEELGKLGVGHIPTDLVPEQWQSVRVYLRSGSCGKLLEAAINPDHESDQILRDFSSNKDVEIVAKIRRLVN